MEYYSATKRNERLIHVTYYNMNETGRHYARLKKLDMKDCVLYGYIYMKCL